jgi:hypothetical protein
MIDLILNFNLIDILILIPILILVFHYTIGGIRPKIRTVAFNTRLLGKSVSACCDLEFQAHQQSTPVPSIQLLGSDIVDFTHLRVSECQKAS